MAITGEMKEIKMDAPYAHEKASMMKVYFTIANPSSYTGKHQEDYLKRVFSLPSRETPIHSTTSGISYDSGMSMKKMYDSPIVISSGVEYGGRGGYLSRRSVYDAAL